MRLRGFLSNLGRPLEDAIRATSVAPTRTKPDVPDADPAVRHALTRDNHWLEPAEVNHLVTAYEAGANLSDLGRGFKVHRTTARRHLLERGIDLRPAHGLAQTLDSDAIVELYESGQSTVKIAAEFETYPNTIRRVLLARGVQMRSSGRR